MRVGSSSKIILGLLIINLANMTLVSPPDKTEALRFLSVVNWKRLTIFQQ